MNVIICDVCGGPIDNKRLSKGCRVFYAEGVQSHDICSNCREMINDKSVKICEDLYNIIKESSLDAYKQYLKLFEAKVITGMAESCSTGGGSPVELELPKPLSEFVRGLCTHYIPPR